MAATAACGDVKATNPDGNGDGPGNNDFSLSLSQSSVTMPIAGSTTVDITVARNGMVGDIALSAEGLGANLTVEFMPTSIASDATTAQATIHAVGGMPAGTSMVMITGTAGDKTHSQTISVTTTTITVNGTVRGGRSGIKVGIIGKGAVTSGSGGAFSFTDVTPPYDLYTYNPTGCGSSMPGSVYFFDDLTRADPTVTAAVSYTTNCTFIVLCFFPGPSAPVSGSKSGTGNNTDAVTWGWSEGNFSNGMLNTNGTYSGTASWCSGNTSTGSLHALQYTKKANGAPNGFLGYAKSGTVTYTSGSAAVTNLVFTAVGQMATVSGTLNGPPSGPMPNVLLYQQFGNTAEVLWNAPTTTAIDANFPIIATAGGSSLYASTNQAGVGQSYFVQPLTATTTLNFTMPAPATLTMPVDAATGVNTTTTFSWMPAAGAVSQISVSGSTAQFRIFTTKGMTSIPVIPELPLPSGAAMNWSVTSYTPTMSINDAAGANELKSVSSNEYTGPAHAVSFSVGRTFTTQ